MPKAKVPLLCDLLAKPKSKSCLRFSFLRAQPDFLLTSLFLAYQALLSPESPADTGFQFPYRLWEVFSEKNLQDPIVQILKMAEVEEKPYFLLVPVSWEGTPWWSFQSQALGGPFPSSFPGCQIPACSQEGVVVWRADMLYTMLPKPLTAAVCGGVSMARMDGIRISGATDALRVREGTVWRGLERSWVETDSQDPT